jgi:hypothetical protein
MNRRLIAGNFAVAVTVQGFVFVVSAAAAFVIPKALTSENFGYWQLFLFYIGFLGFSQLGMSDGLYLRFGGRARKEIDRSSVSQQFLVLVLSQLVIGTGFVLSGLLLASGERAFVLICLGAMVPLFATIRFWGFVFQAMNETRLYSYAVMIQSATFFLPLLALMVCGVSSERPYIVAYVVAQVPALLYCLTRARGLILPTRIRFGELMRESFESAHVGFKLTIATLSANLVLGAARFVVDANWDIATFGAVSLAITVVTFVLTLMAQAALVLFPALRQADPEDQRRALMRIRGVALLVLPAAYLFYFPFVWGLSAWLPPYAESFSLAALLMPMCLFDGLMQVLFATYLKVTRKEGLLMLVNLLAVALSILCAAIAGFVFNSLELVLLSPVAASLIRGLVTDRIFRRDLGLGDGAVMLLWLGLSATFVLSARGLPLPIGFLAVLSTYMLFMLWRRDDVRWIRQTARSAIRPKPISTGDAS